MPPAPAARPGSGRAYSGYQLAETHITAGNVLGVVVGLIVLGVAGYAAYARWDDAGRPSLRQIFRGADAAAGDA